MVNALVQMAGATAELDMGWVGLSMGRVELVVQRES